MIIMKLSWKQIKNKNMNSCRRIFSFFSQVLHTFCENFSPTRRVLKNFLILLFVQDIRRLGYLKLRWYDMHNDSFERMSCGLRTLDLLLTHTSVVARSLFFSSMVFVVACTRYSTAALCSFIHNLWDTYDVLWEHNCCWYLCRTRIRTNWTHRCSAYLQRSFTRDFIDFPNFVK